MVLGRDLPVPTPAGGSFIERQWDVRNENVQGAYTRPDSLARDVELDVNPDGSITLTWPEGTTATVYPSCISCVMITP